MSTEIYGVPVHDFWPARSFQGATAETFGIAPTEAPDDSVTDVTLRKNGYTVDMQYLCSRLGQLVPVLPVQMPSEKAAFKDALPFYLGTTLAEPVKSGPDFDKMAADWNEGTLCMDGRTEGKPDGKRLFRKSSALLKSYHKVTCSHLFLF